MINPHQDWMPMGSIVRAYGGEKLIMIAGFMSIDGATGKAWDYAGYPYPEGKQKAEELFFDRKDIEEVYQLGFCDAEGLSFLEFLTNEEEKYQQVRAEMANSKSNK